MASRAAMLLDPRAYKKQSEANGNDPEPFLCSIPYKPGVAGRASSEPPASYLDSLVPGPQDDPAPSNPVDQSGSLCQGLTQQDTTRTGGTSATAAPAGTFSMAHQLLNPKAQRTSSRTGPKSKSRSSSIPPQTRRNDMLSPQSKSQLKRDVDIEFISGDSQSDGDSQKEIKRPREDDSPGAGHVSLLEDMYGVERREDQPQKRVKAAKEVDEKSVNRKMSQFEISGNTGLGDWMKEGREASDTTPDIVDLTTGNVNLSAHLDQAH
jgi:hypothetical protein